MYASEGGRYDDQGGVTVYNTLGDDDSTQRYNPYDDFSISHCDTYSSLWLWDLSLTCKSKGSLENCECNFAERLMELGMLSCDDAPLCPRECKVCSTCLKLVGCKKVRGSISGATSSSRQSNFALFVIGSAILTLVTVCVVYGARKKSDKSPLGLTLIDDNADISGIATGESPVWLVPINPPAQFDPPLLASPKRMSSFVLNTTTLVGGRDNLPYSPNSPADKVWLAPV